MDGAFAAKVAVEPQIDWSTPALAVVTGVEIVKSITSRETTQPLSESAHSNEYFPSDNPVTVEPGDEGLVMTAEPPEIFDHCPTSILGTFPARVILVVPAEPHWSGPASALVGPEMAEVVISTSSVVALQALVMVQVKV
jgi:hypothetical protein